MSEAEQYEAAIVDAEVIDEPSETPAILAPVNGGREIVRSERRSEVLKPLDTSAVLASFETYQQLLQRLLTPDDWQGAPNRPGSFVKKKGWRKIATAFDLDLKRIDSAVERDAEGNPLRAEACYVAIAPSGRSMDGDGYCSVDEPRFKKATGRQKLENDLRATATTRAKNRAIADLVGMGAVSAEEVEETAPGAAPVGPEYGKVAAPAQVTSARRALGYLLGCQPDDNPVGVVLNDIERRAGDYLPHLPLASIALVALAAKGRARSEVAQPGNGNPVSETAEDVEECERAERIIADV